MHTILIVYIVWLLVTNSLFTGILDYERLINIKLTTHFPNDTLCGSFSEQTHSQWENYSVKRPLDCDNNG